MNLGATVRIPESRCPFCGHKLDAATPAGAGDAVPRPGDVTMCIACAGVLVFEGEPLGVRAATADELREVAGMLPVQAVAAALAMLHGRERRQ